MQSDEASEAQENTDTEIWRERPNDYYADSIHVTKEGAIGIACGGTCITLPIREWFALAALPSAPAERLEAGELPVTPSDKGVAKNWSDIVQEEQKQAALAWMKAQAKAINPEVDDTWATFYLARVISDAIRLPIPASRVEAGEPDVGMVKKAAAAIRKLWGEHLNPSAYDVANAAIASLTPSPKPVAVDEVEGED